MPVKIHHGAPGAYKTSGAVNDDFVTWALEGREVVTNVRGLEDGKYFSEKYELLKPLKCRWFPFLFKWPEIPEGFSIKYVDTETSAGKEVMRNWFKWAPFGCAFLIDEIQTIYPQKFTAADYKKICFNSPEEALAHDKRPEDVYIAFEKHRHYNWDFVVTAPSIKKVPAIIRDIAEVAYYHNNKGKIGLKGLYLEAMHNPDDTGKSATSWISHRMKRAPKKIFTLYSSTSTGITKDTEAGQNIFLQPKVIAVALGLFFFLSFLVSRGNPLSRDKSDDFSFQNDVVPVLENNAAFVSHTDEAPVTGSVVLNSHIPDRPIKRVKLQPLQEFTLEIGGILREPFIYATKDGNSVDISYKELKGLGYSLDYTRRCLWRLTFADDEQWIMCRKDEEKGGGIVRGLIGE